MGASSNYFSEPSGGLSFSFWCGGSHGVSFGGWFYSLKQRPGKASFRLGLICFRVTQILSHLPDSWVRWVSDSVVKLGLRSTRAFSDSASKAIIEFNKRGRSSGFSRKASLVLAAPRGGSPRKPGNTMFRATRYTLNHAAFKGKTLEPGKTLVEIRRETTTIRLQIPHTNCIIERTNGR
jgi:hypothetical protein